MQSEIRQDKVTREWVIFSQARGKRPHDLKHESGPARDLPAHDPGCPFCPGNEEKLGRVLLELPGPAPYGWSTRTIPNKFPALTPRHPPQRVERGIYVAFTGYGQHEVIIESPRHDLGLALMEPGQVEAVVETYHRRYLDHAAGDNQLMVIIFRNHGARAGTSLIHPHSQVVVTPVVPRRIRRRERAAQEYWDQHRSCVYCDIIAHERGDRSRLIHETSRFVAVVPFAAQTPFEMWLMPKHHNADFGEVTDQEKQELAGLLRLVLERLHTKLDDPDYNLVINTSARYSRRAPHLHWYVQIQPRLTTMAGFEIGSGMHINPSLPESDAAFLTE